MCEKRCLAVAVHNLSDGAKHTVETFLKKSSIISYNREALREDGPHIMALANLEGLSAHAKSVAIRTNKKKQV